MSQVTRQCFFHLVRMNIILQEHSHGASERAPPGQSSLHCFHLSNFDPMQELHATRPAYSPAPHILNQSFRSSSHFDVLQVISAVDRNSHKQQDTAACSKQTSLSTSLLNFCIQNNPIKSIIITSYT